MAEHISITSSHLDYQQQNVQSDGVFSPLQMKKYHPGEESEVENEIGEEELQGSSLNRGPYFESLAPKNITAIAGQSAYLNCRVRNLGNRTVSDDESDECGRDCLNVFLLPSTGVMAPASRLDATDSRQGDIHARPALSERAQSAH